MFRTICLAALCLVALVSAGYAAELPAVHTTHSIESAPEPPAQFASAIVLPAPLARGVVVIAFHADNLKLVPVYGDAAVAVTPRIGHLHITLDEAAWHWLQASEELIVIQGLAKGPHHVVLDLADPAHHVLASKRLDFVIPG
ncbi:MAG: DUF6130 family protein [Ancalomicrobiaceae bacterium]|nr:DUF6130 family protein [Ancalomicrobiaceae bacterium]